jgi:hypothetical protein
MEEIVNPATSFYKLNPDIDPLNKWSKQWIVTFNQCMLCFISLTYTRKRRGPSIDPWVPWQKKNIEKTKFHLTLPSETNYQDNLSKLTKDYRRYQFA